MRMVIKNGLVVSPDDNGTYQRRADIVVEGDLIEYLGPVGTASITGAMTLL